MSDSELLERLAAEELLSEAKRGAARASLSGPSGWQKCPLPKTNKKFLNNTLLHTLSSNRLRGKNVEPRSKLDIEPMKCGTEERKSTPRDTGKMQPESGPIRSKHTKEEHHGPNKPYNRTKSQVLNTRPSPQSQQHKITANI